MKTGAKIALALANIGAINWGLATLNWNLVEKAIGSWAGTMGNNIIYAVIAICGIYGLIKVFKK